MENKKCSTVGSIPKSNIKIVERGKIDTINTQIHDCSLSWLGNSYCIVKYLSTTSVDSVLASSAVDYGFEPRSGKTKDYKIGICCFCAKHAALIKEKQQRLVGSESG
jgi:hypothetical protein